ncbi:TonB-dependent receptor [Rhodanobacter sp. PCA2]|uniref:TonB-dependent receptor n=1 Tax=Rhodanobacter sp. PCA2 TaxID=2006117 RepID=UPI001C632892|nr:TonB-dependent receptor [Rhodanobacter sp. PCA2]
MPRKTMVAAVLLACLSPPTFAQAVPTPDSDPAPDDRHATELERITVLGRRQDLVGNAISASEGSVSADDLARRPLLRTGDLIEFVPGLVATQHSGSGKANQYFLRGFNLDHGTDFATWVDGMPVNLRTHAHGQGYTDLNFLIPELVQTLTYRKGPYHADVGDFSAAGSASFELFDKLDQGLLEVGIGENGWGRTVFADSFGAGGGDLLIGAELQRDDGPWTDIHEDVNKRNLVLRYSHDAGNGVFRVTAMDYRNTWNSPDQIPQRAVDQGLIDALGSLDTTVGGESSRHSLSGSWDGNAFGGQLRVSAYAIGYKLSLWSDFTYFLDHPDTGDQFEQHDNRHVYGYNAVQEWSDDLGKWQFGAEGRRDDIAAIGLYHTQHRMRLSTIRMDSVVEDSIGMFVARETHWTDRFRSYLGVRWDLYDFDVDSLQPENAGHVGDSLVSAKASLAFRAADALDLYASWGQGLHSNDARGTTTRVDPVSGDPVKPVDPLVRSTGREFGARWQPGKKLHATFALWDLKLDSELLFVGDAGNTEASRRSKRRGAELGIYWFPDERIAVDAELSWTKSEFSDSAPQGNRIPGAIPFVANLGVRANFDGGWYLGGRLRHFAAYPLVEDGSHESAGTTVVNLRVGKDWKRFGLALDVLNLLDSDDHDIDYWYASRLPGEPAAGVEDTHFHPMAPRSLRLTARWSL